MTLFSHYSRDGGGDGGSGGRERRGGGGDRGYYGGGHGGDRGGYGRGGRSPSPYYRSRSRRDYRSRSRSYSPRKYFKKSLSFVFRVLVLFGENFDDLF